MISFAPFATLAFWGASYALDCIRTLEAPGVPIEMSIVTKAGDLTFRVRSYSLHPQRGDFYLSQPQFFDAKGNLIAELDSLNATGLKWSWGAQQILKVHAVNLRGTLIRLENGQFDFQSFLPEHQGVNSPLPFDIDVNGVNLHLVDLGGRSPWTSSVTAQRVKVAGVGQDWLASTTAHLSGVGTVVARIQNSTTDGLQIQGKTISLKMDGLLKHLIQTRQFKNLVPRDPVSFDSFAVQGPFQVFVPKDKPLHLEANLEAHLTRLKYQNFTAESVSYLGKLTSQGASGSVQIIEGPSTATFRGTAKWGNQFEAGGELEATVPSVLELPNWARSLAPNSTGLTNGSFHGWLGIKKGGAYHVSGELLSDSIRYANQQIDDVRIGVDAEPKHIVLDVRRAKLAKDSFTGILNLNPENHSISGSFLGEKINLASAANVFGYHQVSGTGYGSILVGGTIQKPNIDFVARGQGLISPIPDHTFSLGQFDVAGRYAAGTIQINRAVFNAPEGLIEAHGSLGAKGVIGLNLVGRGILLGAYDSKIGGTANFTATVKGSLKNPTATGRMEGYDLSLKGKSLPAIVTNFSVNSRHAVLQNLEAASGTSALTGSSEFLFRTKAITGDFTISDVQLADWLGEDWVGAIDIPNLRLSGTIGRPIAHGNLVGSSVVGRGTKIDKLAANFDIDGDDLFLVGGQLKLANGSLEASGHYNLSSQLGTVSANASSLAMNQLSPELINSGDSNASISGKADLTFRSTQITNAEASGRLDTVKLSGSLFGGGTWKARLNSGLLEATLNINGDNRSIRLGDCSYDIDSKKIAGSLKISNLPIADVTQTALPFLSTITSNQKDALTSLTGNISGTCAFNGVLEEPNVKVDQLRLSDLSFRKQSIGNVNSQFQLSNHIWNIQNFSLQDGPASLSLSGTIDQHGDMHLDATNDNKLDLDQIAKFDPAISQLTGTAHVWFTADGPIASPRVVASLNVDNLLGQVGAGPREEHNDKFLRFEFDKIVIDPNDKSIPGIDATGSYFYKGLQGSIHASLPFAYPFTIPADEQIEATLSFDKSDLKTIAPLVGGIDPSRTEGSVQGDLKLSGTSRNIIANGEFRLTANTLGFSGVDDTLRTTTGQLTVSSTQIGIAASAKSSRGGTISANLSVPIDNLVTMFDQARQKGGSFLLDRTLSGKFSADNLQVFQHILGQSTVAGIANTAIDISGSINQPILTGAFSLASGDVVTRALPTDTFKPVEVAINPIFNVGLTITEPMELRSSNAELYLIGTGTLLGSLKDPKVDASMVVERGSIRLPASVLRLDQGGTIKVSYGVAAAGKASAIVDLEGNTGVTASRYADTDIQRYDVTVGIKGDLLQDNGLNLVATSDPPDLTQDRILAILGAGDVFQSISTGTKETSAIQSAMLSAVPMFLDPYTNQVAKELGLDFLSLQYNSYDLASVAFGKAFGQGLSIEGTRQLSEPPPGFPSRYDIRLLYRPRRLFGSSSRVRLFVGFDQDKPYKVGLEYSVRFATHATKK